ncbi:MAG: ATP-binding protein [Cellulomonadaceae bacterium]|nr:ATP-binding protein [Cellulomonadaceae bacterium]
MTASVNSSFLPRHAMPHVLEALSDTRVVLVNGARQVGKSTLVRRAGRETDASWYTLDDGTTAQLAAKDPSAFVRLSERMIVDEIQRDPQLLLAMKSLVDEIPTPGRFLLTGSARLMGLRNLPDSLVGRMETIELWPLSQGEIDGTPDRFVDAAFELGPDVRHESTVTRDDYITRITRGGFPGVYRRSERRRADSLNNYVADLINRDVTQLSEIERGKEMRDLVLALAGCSGQLIAPTTLGEAQGLDAKTTKRYLRLLEEVFLIKRIPAWSRRISHRAVSQDKLAFVDSGVASALLDQTASRLRKPGAPLGGLLEGFVVMEIARQLTWNDTRAEISHYRTKDKVEVDIVLEDRHGQVIGIEVKASASPLWDDFRGLRHLEERVGDDFIAGYVLHTGAQTLPFGSKMRAVPVSALWQIPAP